MLNLMRSRPRYLSQYKQTQSFRGELKLICSSVIPETKAFIREFKIDNVISLDIISCLYLQRISDRTRNMYVNTIWKLWGWWLATKEVCWNVLSPGFHTSLNYLKPLIYTRVCSSFHSSHFQHIYRLSLSILIVSSFHSQYESHFTMSTLSLYDLFLPTTFLYVFVLVPYPSHLPVPP